MSRIPTIDLELPPVVPFAFPLQGINETWARGNQPDGTTPDCLNVMPYDLTGRARGGVRPGVVSTGTNTYGVASGTNNQFCQWLQQVTVEVGTSQTNNTVVWTHIKNGTLSLWTGKAVQGSDTTASRAEFVTGFWGGKAYYGTDSSNLIEITGGSTNRVSSLSLISGTLLDGVQYLVDGTGIYMIDYTVDPPLWGTYTASSGTSPASTHPRVCCTYRKRLIVGGGLADAQPENFYASKVGNAHDWNYNGPGPDSAWAGNAAKSGQPGEPVTALIPLGDDALVIGCDRSVWLMNGDIADGGRIDVISRGIGIVNQNAWGLDPNGNLYFVGQNAFYRMNRGVYTIEDLSTDKYPSFFVAPLDVGAYQVVYDKDRHGFWIFKTPVNQSAATQLWYDLRTQGFFPIQFPNGVGPLRSMSFEHAGNALPREILMSGFPSGGTNNGTNKVELYKLAATNATDAGSAINSYVWLGPAQPSGSTVQEARMIQCDFTLGETPAGFLNTDWNVTYTLQSGNSAYQAFNAPHDTRTGTFTTPGRQTAQRTRLRGQAFWCKLANSTGGKIWNVENVGAMYLAGGRVRA